MNQGSITHRELLSQPDRWQALIDRVRRQPGALPEVDIGGFDEAVVFGSGSSYYLAMILADLIERQTGTTARALPSCELILDAEHLLPRNGRRRLAIAVSRSGESSEVLLAAEATRAAGLPLLGIGCYPDSALMALAEHRLLLPEGQETGLVMLRSFTSMLLGFQLLLGGRGGDERLRGLARSGRRLLERDADALSALANSAPFSRFVFLGSGVTYPLTREAALKMQEMAIVTSEAYHALEYRHGPKSTAGPDTLITLFALDGDDHFGPELLHDLGEYGVTSLVIAERAEGYSGVADLVIELAGGGEQLQRAALALLPVHLLAFETALRLGQNPDAPRNLTQVVKL